MGIPWVKKFWSFCTLGRHGWRKNFLAAEGGRQIFWGVPWEFGPQMIFFLLARVWPGYITTFLITPFQIVTSANARGLSVNDRKCMFKHDKEDLTLFKGYSQANCLFECQLKIAYDKCQCVPWDYPHLNDSWSICDRFGRECFLDMMIKVDLHKECNCILDCAITRYTYSLHANKINAEELCSKKEYLSFMSSGTKGYPPKFIRRYEQIVYGKDIGNDVLCQNRTRNMAIVRFQIADQIITRIKKTQRMTFADFVSNIGMLHT